MRCACLLVFIAFLIAASYSKVYFSEVFDDGIEHWKYSSWMGEGQKGKFSWGAGKGVDNPEGMKGLETMVDSKFYTAGISFDELSNENKLIAISYIMRFGRTQDCVGGYIKVYGSGVDLENMDNNNNYKVMFGPDVCGSKRKIHLIHSYAGKTYACKNTVAPPMDPLFHSYTLVVRPDNSFSIMVDGENVSNVTLVDDFDIFPKREIPDESVKKPEDWVDERVIDDPDDKKPEGWVDEPQEIDDMDAKKPEEWNDEVDGEWVRPKIRNPKYVGVWTPKKIPNPAFKHDWVPPMIPNPDFWSDEKAYVYDSIGAIVLELWQVTSGTVFKEFKIVDDLKDLDGIKEKLESLNKRISLENSAERDGKYDGTINPETGDPKNNDKENQADSDLLNDSEMEDDGDDPDEL